MCGGSKRLLAHGLLILVDIEWMTLTDTLIIGFTLIVALQLVSQQHDTLIISMNFQSVPDRSSHLVQVNCIIRRVIHALVLSLLTLDTQLARHSCVPLFLAQRRRVGRSALIL